MAEALRHAWGDVDYMVGEYKKRRDLIFSRLSKIDGFEILRPDGAFYAFTRIKKLGMTSMELCTYLLEEAGVSTVPGQGLWNGRRLHAHRLLPPRIGNQRGYGPNRRSRCEIKQIINGIRRSSGAYP